MKKFTVLCLAGLLILAFGATGYAQAPKLDFRASGFIDTQTFLGENVSQRNNGLGLSGSGGLNPATAGGLYEVTNPNFAFQSAAQTPTKGLNHTTSDWEARAHLKFDAVMGKELSGTIYFEIDTFRYGAAWSLTGGLGREANQFGGWTTDRTSIEVKNIYIDLGLPYFGIPVPVTLRVGAQPLGIRPNMMVYSDGTGVTAGIKLDPVMINPLWFKALQGSDFNANGVNVWGLQANAKVSTFTLGGYGLYYNMDSYPFFVITPVAGLPSALSPSVTGTQQAKMWWLGLYADGKAGPVNLNFDFIYDFGRVVSKDPTGKITTDIPNVKYSGFATRLKVDYPWEKFNFGAIGMYASGSNTEKTSSTGLAGTLTSTGALSSRVGGYVVPPGSEQDTNNGESVVVYSMEAGATGGYGIAENASYSQMSRGGFGGTWFAKLYGSYKVTPDWKVTLQGLYIGDTTKNGNTLSNAVIPGTTILRNDSDIGFELDLLSDWQIYKNLRFWVGGGYLFAGSALDIRQGTLKDNFSPHNPWAFRTRLMYTF